VAFKYFKAYAVMSSGSGSTIFGISKIDYLADGGEFAAGSAISALIFFAA
jgi:hypothetical protein